MHIPSVIQQLGYTPSETKIYLASLELGESTITEIAQKVNIPRTSVQHMLDAMHRRGLMNNYVQKRHKYWVAANPEKLLVMVQEQEEALKSILPELKAKHLASSEKPNVKMFSGVQDIKNIMDDIIDSKKHLLAIVSWEDWRAFFGDDFVDDFVERRYKHFLKVRLLTPRTESATKLKSRDVQELRSSRFLQKNIDINNSNFIYGNKVAIISLNKRSPIGIVIEDPDIAHTMTLLFETMWNQSDIN